MDTLPPTERARDLWTSGKLRWFILVGIGVWLHAADSLVTATIAPNIVEDLGGVAYLNWTISLYQVGAILAGAAAGVLCRRRGIKPVFIGATLVYAAGCILGALSPTMGLLVASRLVQGMGGGMLLSLCYIAVEAWFAPEVWNRLFAFVATIWGGGSLLGPLIGAAFAGHHIWRNAFWAFALQAIAVALLGLRWLPATPDAPAGAGAPAAAPAPATPIAPAAGRWPFLPLLILAAATLLIAEAGAVTASQRGLSLSVAGCLLGIALLYVAARIDRRGPVRLLPRQLLDIRHTVGAGLMMVFTLAAASTGFWAYGPLLLKILFDTPPLVTGYILAGEAIAWSLGTMATAQARPEHDGWLIRSGAIAIALGAGGFVVAVPAGSFAGMVLCALVQGAGFGVCWPAVVQRAVRSSDADERALASASVSTVQRIGYAVGTAAVGIAANLSGLAEGMTAGAARAAAVWVFAAFIPLLLIGVALAWRFTDTRSGEQRA